jgi:hypothetical protein
MQRRTLLSTALATALGTFVLAAPVLAQDTWPLSLIHI